MASKDQKSKVEKQESSFERILRFMEDGIVKWGKDKEARGFGILALVLLALLAILARFMIGGGA